MDYLLELFLGLAQSNPTVASVIFGMGLLRVLFKPLFGAYEAYVAWSESKKDDAKLEEFKSGKAYKSVLWFLDFIGSIKVKSLQKKE